MLLIFPQVFLMLFHDKFPSFSTMQLPYSPSL